jgi:hypothetical protein
MWEEMSSKSAFNQILSFIIVTSPSPSHPSTAMLERVINSVHSLNLLDTESSCLDSSRTTEASIHPHISDERKPDIKNEDRSSSTDHSFPKIIIIFDGYIVQDKVQSKKGKVSRRLADSYEGYYQKVLQCYGNSDQYKIIRANEHIGFAMAVKLGM